MKKFLVFKTLFLNTLVLKILFLKDIFFNNLMSKIFGWQLISMLVVLCSLMMSAVGIAKTKLRVMTYDTFVSSYGPGQSIKEAFEKECLCEVNYELAGNSGTLLSRLKLAGSTQKSDLVIGLDSHDARISVDKKIFIESKIDLSSLSHLNLDPSIAKFLVPFDTGLLAIMWDSEKLKDPPRNMDELLSRKDLNKKLIFSDPRFSSTGLSFVLWLQMLYRENLPSKFGMLRQQTLTVTPGWSEGYGLFVKGEAPLIVSYLTSEAYHKISEKTDRYRALRFPSHIAVSEFGGVLKSSKSQELAMRFLQFLLTPNSQKLIAEKNWMLPVIKTHLIPGINPWFKDPQIKSVISIKPVDEAQKKEIKSLWLKEFK